MADEYTRYERRRAGRGDRWSGRYGHSPVDSQGHPRGQGYGYAWRGEFGNQFVGEGYGRGGYFGEPWDYDFDDYQAEPRGPGYDAGGGIGSSGVYKGPHRGRKIDWREPGPHTGKGPRRPQPPDDEIRRTILQRMQRLEEDHYLNAADNIQVSVENGEVTLEGTVRSRMEKISARDVADFAPGVRDVHNHLTIERGK